MREKGLSRIYLPKENTKRVNVSALIIGLIGQNLRSEVEGILDETPSNRLVCQLTSRSKIRKLRMRRSSERAEEGARGGVVVEEKEREKEGRGGGRGKYTLAQMEEEGSREARRTFGPFISPWRIGMGIAETREEKVREARRRRRKRRKYSEGS